MFPASDTSKNCKLTWFTTQVGVEMWRIESQLQEYIAASMCATKVIWLRNLMEEITGEVSDGVTLKIDNVSAINLAKNPISHGRSKHIEMRCHYLREQVNNGLLKLEHCRSEVQIADMLTKSVQTDVFKRLSDLMGVTSLATMN
ncbi:unnamed protein product [Trifolium pratense]|nr:unnamed protein product [Trifolium pratense]